MKTETISPTELDGLDIEDELADFTADVLSLKANEKILHRLFSNPLGKWSNLASFLNDYDEIIQRLAKLQGDCDGTLQVTWLQHPELNQGYCLVLFYMDSLGWDNLALYNKERLEKSENTLTSR